MNSRERKVAGAIKPLEQEAFRHRTKKGSQLKCYKPRLRADDEVKLITMAVLQIHPYILVMGYKGTGNKILTTSMTWAEAIILNRMTQWELFEEVKLMQEEKGQLFYASFVEVRQERKRKINRDKCAPLIVSYRAQGMTYAQIASIIGISASMARDIYNKEGQYV